MKQQSILVRPTPISDLLTEFTFLTEMEQESKLDMALAVVPIMNPMPQIEQFKHHFKWKDHTSLDVIAMGIKNTAFQVLYQKALSKYQEGDTYITALRIHHGATDCSQVLFFSPVYLKSSDGINFNVIEVGRYLYDDKKEEFVEFYIPGLDTDYRGNILVKPSLSSAHGGFISGRDVESVTYSFQTIYTMIFDSLNYNKDYVTITNALPVDKETGDLLYKHSLLLMATETEHGTVDPTFNGNYANRSHLCPPGCRKISDLDSI